MSQLAEWLTDSRNTISSYRSSAESGGVRLERPLLSSLPPSRSTNTARTLYPSRDGPKFLPLENREGGYPIRTTLIIELVDRAKTFVKAMILFNLVRIESHAQAIS